METLQCPHHLIVITRSLLFVFDFRTSDLDPLFRPLFRSQARFGRQPLADLAGEFHQIPGFL
jgi:hypothetical protein